MDFEQRQRQQIVFKLAILLVGISEAYYELQTVKDQVATLGTDVQQYQDAVVGSLYEGVDAARLQSAFTAIADIESALLDSGGLLLNKLNALRLDTVDG